MIFHDYLLTPQLFSYTAILQRNTVSCIKYQYRSALPQDFKDIKEQYLFDVKSIVLMKYIPQEMILNWDQVGMKIFPSSAWTMEKSGVTRVEITAIDDKRQITAVFSWVIPSYSVNIQRNYCKMSAKGGQISKRMECFTFC